LTVVGVDFDNTIVGYDAVFGRVALGQGLVPPAAATSKQAVRDHLRRTGREDVWTGLQGEVYGARMADAQPLPGALDFFRRCRGAGVPALVISHKTRYPYAGARHDLHAAAYAWLEQYGFFDLDRIGLQRSAVFFELTKEDKLRRIAQAGCTHFVDDLPELLEEPTFPAGVARILIDLHGAHPESTAYRRARSWDDVSALVLGAAARSG